MPPAVEPWKVTEQVPVVVERVQVVELNEPPVVPAFRVNVPTPEGKFVGVVVSIPVAVQEEL